MTGVANPLFPPSDVVGDRDGCLQGTIFSRAIIRLHGRLLSVMAQSRSYGSRALGHRGRYFLVVAQGHVGRQTIYPIPQHGCAGLALEATKTSRNLECPAVVHKAGFLFKVPCRPEYYFSVYHVQADKVGSGFEV